MNTTTASTACDAYIEWPITSACSGHGYCSSLGQCICDDGWGGRGEFIDRTGKDCNVNYTIVMVIHLVGIVTAVWAFAVAAQANWRAVQVARNLRVPAASSNSAGHHAQQQRPVVTSGPVWLWNVLINDSASYIGIYVMVLSPGCVIYHIMRITMKDSSEVFAFWPSTLAMVIVPTVFWIGTACYAWILIKHTNSSISHTRGTAGAKAAKRKMLYALTVDATIGSIGSIVASIWNRAAMSLQSQENAMITFYTSTSITGVWMFLIIVYHAYRAIQQINTLNDPKLAPARKRLIWVTAFICVACNMGYVMTFLLAYWPFLRNQTAYLSPCVFIFGNNMSLIARQIWTAQSVAEDKPAATQRSGRAIAAATPSHVIHSTKEKVSGHNASVAQPSPSSANNTATVTIGLVSASSTPHHNTPAAAAATKRSQISPARSAAYAWSAASPTAPSSSSSAHQHQHPTIVSPAPTSANSGVDTMTTHTSNGGTLSSAPSTTNVYALPHSMVTIT